MLQSDKELFFVYGTLMSGYGNNRLLQNEELIGPALSVEKYTMMASGIPFVFPTPATNNILGELWAVNKSSIPSLDSLEGHPDWYKREKINVACKGKIYSAWIYFMPKDADISSSNLTLIDNGNYRIYREM